MRKGDRVGVSPREVGRVVEQARLDVRVDRTFTVRDTVPGCTVEVLIPDFQGDPRALGTVVGARPEVLAHNVETVPRL